MESNIYRKKNCERREENSSDLQIAIESSDFGGVVNIWPHIQYMNRTSNWNIL